MITDIDLDRLLMVHGGWDKVSVGDSNGADVVRAYVDRDKMSQVIHNLVSNGLKFTSPGGRVTVRATLEEAPSSTDQHVHKATMVSHMKTSGIGSALVKIAVTDTGAGLSEARGNYPLLDD